MRPWESLSAAAGLSVGGAPVARESRRCRQSGGARDQGGLVERQGSAIAFDGPRSSGRDATTGRRVRGRWEQAGESDPGRGPGRSSAARHAQWCRVAKIVKMFEFLSVTGWSTTVERIPAATSNALVLSTRWSRSCTSTTTC